jgi:hypothetical protein
MPAARPLTAAAAAAQSATAGPWADEAPAVSWQDDLGHDAGQSCGDCGAPMRWTGAHSAIACPACGAWAESPGASERTAALAADRKRRRGGSPRAAAAAVDPADRAELLDDLAALAELVDVTGWPRGHGHIGQIRKFGVRYAGQVASWIADARTATTADQLTEIARQARELATSPDLKAWHANAPLQRAPRAAQPQPVARPAALALPAGESWRDDDGEDDEPAAAGYDDGEDDERTAGGYDDAPASWTLTSSGGSERPARRGWRRIAPALGVAVVLGVAIVAGLSGGTGGAAASAADSTGNGLAAEAARRAARRWGGD